MKTFGPRTSNLAGARVERTSLPAPAGPIGAGLDAAGRRRRWPPPQVSVMPQPSRIGTPSARYQLIRSGEIGAAPVNAEARAVDADHACARCSAPASARAGTAASAARRHRLARQHARRRPALPTPMRPGVGRLLQPAGLRSAIVTPSRTSPTPAARRRTRCGAISRTFSGTVSGFSTKLSTDAACRRRSSRRPCARRCGTAAGSTCARRARPAPSSGCSRAPM